MEEEYRFKIFKENKYAIAEHNKLFAEGKVSFEMGINHLSDMLSHEIVETMTGINADPNNIWMDRFEASSFVSNPNILVSDSFDWRDKGAVTPVKNQGDCGSCWAFSATGALEGQWFLKTNHSIPLSEQNVIDCSKENRGCNGGWPSKAFQYIKVNKGIDTEEAYPYTGTDSKCHYNREGKGATVSGFVTVEPGPISVAINVRGNEFHNYKSGVYDSSQCGRRPNHGVLIVGYGTEGGVPYWIVNPLV